MKFELPDNHGLSSQITDNPHLFFLEEGKPALSDAQYAALEAGAARGESLLVVSPTSTGKTHIALWGIAKGIEDSCKVVYLVTHRALAKQKFDDFKSILLHQFLDGSASDLVIATGDYVATADGDVSANPLSATLLVATYEKYLAMLSASGIPKDMSTTVLVCDEIQLVGDPSRGQNVEVLLTLVRNAGWRQFIGLSAVLENRDAKDLADWLGVTPVICHTREKHLHYECWTNSGIATVTTEQPDNIEEGISLPSVAKLDVLSVLQSIISHKTIPPPLPVIVFCMTKAETSTLAQGYAASIGTKSKQPPLPFDGMPETSANTILSSIMAKRVAYHNSDLLDEERIVVEKHLLEGKLDVVFATSTLAAGVNFPLGAAIFASWKRWDRDKRVYVPIEADEFHNMAGRVGRMGFQHEQGRVIFLAPTPADLRPAKKYLSLGVLPSLKPRIRSQRFNQLVLQLVASGLCEDTNDIRTLVCNTFSALRENDTNPISFQQWPSLLVLALDDLCSANYVIKGKTSGNIAATPVGKAIAFCGLLPETASYLLEYIATKGLQLLPLLPSIKTSTHANHLYFCLLAACYSTPEFRTYNKKPPTRYLPYPLEGGIMYDPRPYRNELPEEVWEVDPTPLNASGITLDWIEGVELRTMEASVQQLSAGMLFDMFRNCSWILQGFAGIIEAAADNTVPTYLRPSLLNLSEEQISLVRRLPRLIRRLSFRISEGLPDDVLWMGELHTPESEFRLFRHEILELRKRVFITPEQIMLGTEEADQVRLAVFTKVKPSPHQKANWLRDTCRGWKKNHRKRTALRHAKRAQKCPNVELVEAFYTAKGTQFEAIFESVLDVLNIKYEKLDNNTTTGAPDYLILLQDSPKLVFELKSREGDNLVDYNRAVEVLAASEVHGHRDAFCVTLCHPGVDPSIPAVIASCGRLSVVESTDLGEALLRLCEGSLTQTQLWKWLATPGQALSSDIPFQQ